MAVRSQSEKELQFDKFELILLVVMDGNFWPRRSYYQYDTETIIYLRFECFFVSTDVLPKLCHITVIFSRPQGQNFDWF
jgi:hypothetical protein